VPCCNSNLEAPAAQTRAVRSLSARSGTRTRAAGARPAQGAGKEDRERAIRCCSDGGRQIRSLRKASEGAAGKKHKPKIRSGRNKAESGENGEDDQYLRTRNKKRTLNNFYS